MSRNHFEKRVGSIIKKVIFFFMGLTLSLFFQTVYAAFIHFAYTFQVYVYHFLEEKCKNHIPILFSPSSNFF